MIARRRVLMRQRDALWQIDQIRAVGMLSPTLDEQLQIVLGHVQLVHAVRLHTRDSVFGRLGLRYRRRFLHLLLYTRHRILLSQPGMISALLGHHTFAEIFDSFFVKMIPIHLFRISLCTLFSFFLLVSFFLSLSLSYTHTRAHTRIHFVYSLFWAGSVQLFVVFSTMEMYEQWNGIARVFSSNGIFWIFVWKSYRPGTCLDYRETIRWIFPGRFWMFFFFRTTIDGLIWTERREWLFVSSWREWRIEIVRNLIRKKHKNCIVRVKISRLLRSKRSMEVRTLLVFPKNITSLRVTSNMSKMKKTCSGLIRHKGRERKSKNNRERVTTKNVAVTVQMTENVIYSFMLFRLNLNIIILLYFFWYICDMKYFLNIIGNIQNITFKKCFTSKISSRIKNLSKHNMKKKNICFATDHTWNNTELPK